MPSFEYETNLYGNSLLGMTEHTTCVHVNVYMSARVNMYGKACKSQNII